MNETVNLYNTKVGKFLLVPTVVTPRHKIIMVKYDKEKQEANIHP